MLRLFQAGRVAAVRQLSAVIIITLMLWILVSQKLFLPGAVSIDERSEGFWSSLSPLLVWAYLLVAAGLVFTSTRTIDLVALRLQRTIYLIRIGNKREHVLTSLAVQFGLAAIMFAVLALRSPPAPHVDAVRYFGLAYVASALWAAGMSVGAAFFGANAHAALKAFKGECRSE